MKKHFPTNTAHFRQRRLYVLKISNSLLNFAILDNFQSQILHFRSEFFDDNIIRQISDSLELKDMPLPPAATTLPIRAPV